MSASVFQQLDESVYDLLEAVRKRPGLYIGEPSVFRLRSFLDGYLGGLGRVGYTVGDVADFHRFHDWVARKLGFSSSTSGWANMIRNRTSSDEAAFDQFFVLLGEFRKKHESPKV